MAKLLSNTRVYGTATVDTQLFVQGSNSAHSTNTGALQVSGGIGVAGSGFFSGTVTATNFVGLISGTAQSANNVVGGTAGQLVYQSAPSTTAFAGPGTAGQILTSGGTGAPTYVNTVTFAVGLSKNLLGGSAGQFAYQTAANSTDFVSTASMYVGRAILADSVVGNSVGTATNLAGGTAGQVPYQTGPGATGFYGPGTAGQLLVSGGAAAPVYTNTASVFVGNATLATDLRGGSSGQILFQSNTNDTDFVGPGTAGQVLTSNGTAGPSYVNTGSLYVGRATVADTVVGGTGFVNSEQQTANAPYYLLFVDANNAVATAENVFTTSTFVVNPSTGFIGLGTANPSDRLELSAAANAARIRLTNTTAGRSSILGHDSTGFYYQPTSSSDLFQLRNDVGTAQFTYNPNTSNVGIGTDVPIEKLHVNGTTGDTRIRVSADDGTNYRGFEVRAGTVFKGGLFYRTTEGNVLQIWGPNDSSNAIQIDANNMVRVRATTSAHSTNTGALQVSGGIGVAGGGVFGGVVTATTFIGNISGSTTQVNTQQSTSTATHFLTFVDANNSSPASESILTTSSVVVNPASGSVGIGTTTPNLLIISRRALTISAGVTGENVVGLDLQASSNSTVGDTPISYINFYQKQNRYASIVGSKGEDEVKGKIQFWNSSTYGTAITKKLEIDYQVDIFGNFNQTGIFQGGALNIVQAGTIKSHPWVRLGASTAAQNAPYISFERAGPAIDSAYGFIGLADQNGYTPFQSGMPPKSMGIRTPTDGSLVLNTDSIIWGTNYGSFVEKMRIRTDAEGHGRILLGTTSIQLGYFTARNSFAPGLVTFGTGLVGGSNTLEIRTGSGTGTVVTCFDSRANLGIGTANPTSRLHVVGDGLFTGVVTATNFVGSVTGSISGNAATVSTQQSISTATHFLTFVDANNASATAETALTTSSVVVTPSTGFVGIGTNTVGFPLTVVSSDLTAGEVHLASFHPSTRSDGSVSIGYFSTGTNDSYGFVRSRHSVDLGLGAGQPNHMFIKQSGNVGIGTTSPAGLFSVATASGSGSTVTAWSSGHAIFGPNVGSTTGAALGLTYNTTGDRAEILSLAPTVAWKPLWLYSSGLEIYAAGAGHAMSVTTGGLVGIGTASPGARLDVVTGTARWRITNDGSGDVVEEALDSAGTAYRDLNSYALNHILYTSGSERMRLDASGNLGIGYSSPAYRLQLAGVLGFRANSVNIPGLFGSGFGYSVSSYPAVVIGDGSGTQSICLNYDPVVNLSGAFSGNGSEIVVRNIAQFIQPDSANTTFRRFVLTLNDGNVGIGTASPSVKLDVVGAIRATTTISAVQNFRLNDASFFRVADLSPGGFVGGYNIKSDGSTGAVYDSTGATGGYGVYLGTLTWYTGTSAAAGTAAPERMRLDTSGNLGIGTASPGRRLHLKQDGTTAFCLAYFENANSTAQPSIGCAGSAVSATNLQNHMIVWNQANNSDMVFGTSNTERMRINSDGAVLIGRTGTYTSSSDRFVVDGGISAFTRDSGYPMYVNRNTTTGILIEFSYGGFGGKGNISTDGTNVAYNTSSDRRLKLNIQPASSAGNIIDNIEIVEHDWITGMHTRYGVVAQDLYEVVPEAVKVGDNEEQIKETWGVDYSKLVPILVKEIQELRARVAALEDQNK